MQPPSDPPPSGSPPGDPPSPATPAAVAPQTKTSPTEQRKRTCRCGHAIGHPLVHPEPKYSFGGWLMLLCGATPSPLHAVYICSRCKQQLGLTKDPKILAEFS